MKGAKELADQIRRVGDYDWRLGCAIPEWADIATHLDRLAEVEQELARIKGAGLAENLAVIEQAMAIWRHAEASPMCDRRGLPGAQVMGWIKDLLDAVRVLTAERDEAREQVRGWERIADRMSVDAATAAAEGVKAEFFKHAVRERLLTAERDAARAEVEQLKAQLLASEDNAREQKALAEMAIATSERRTQETMVAEEALRMESDRLRTAQHGEAEALKMMAAEKQRADRLAEGIVKYREERQCGFELMVVDTWESEHGHLVPR